MVKPVQGDILIVDDYPLDNENNTLSWYSSIMDTLVGETGYSVWEIGDELPFSSTDVPANLKYLNIFFGLLHIIIQQHLMILIICRGESSKFCNGWW